MDVIKPELYWVNNRCYRRNPTREDYSKYKSGELAFTREETAVSQLSELKPYEEPDDEVLCDPIAPEDLGEEDYTFVETPSGFKLDCPFISSRFFPVIIGAKGVTKQRLERDTNTKIIIPRINEKGFLAIRGKSKKDIVAAVRRLELLCSQARLRWDATHFLCFPLNQSNIVQKCTEFKELVLELLGSAISEAVFTPPEKLHFTITALILIDALERDDAIKLLDNARADLRQILGADKLLVQIRGLEIMNDDPSEANILYAKAVTRDDKLQQLADYINQQYQRTGHAKPTKGSNVKLHATLMNTRYLNDTVDPSSAIPNESNGKSNGRGRQRQFFDAREIFQRYKDFDFGTVEINEIRLCTIHTVAEDGFYKRISEVSF